MSPSTLLTAFATVFVAELPDKTMVATIVLVARHRRPLAVWIGAVAAFAVHVTVAVVAGGAIGRLPDPVVGIAVFLLFAVGAAAMWRAARRSSLDIEDVDVADAERNTVRVVVGSFAFVALAEWGDLTQLATAGLAARSDSPVSVWLGALIALAAVASIASTAGRHVIRRIPIHRVNLIAAAVFAGLAIWTLIEVVRGS